MAGNEHGGAETAFVDTCIAMHQSDLDNTLDIRVLTRPNKIRVPALQKAGIDVHTLPFGGPLDFYTPYAIARHVKDFKPDIIQSWMSRAASKVKTSAKYAHKRHLAIHVARLGNYYKLKNFGSADAFVTITSKIQDYLEQNGIPPEDIKHINNFADTETPLGTDIRKDRNIPADTPLLLALGRLHDDKAYDILLLAMADIPKAQLLIAGEGPDKDKLKTLAQSLGLSGRVHFLGWRTDRADLFKAADICVFASRDEPFGTVFVQSWMHKTPVVVSDADGPKAYVRNGEDGLVVKKENPAELTKAINTLINEPPLQEILIKNGYQRYLNEFTKEGTIEDYKKFYDDLIKRKSP